MRRFAGVTGLASLALLLSCGGSTSTASGGCGGPYNVTGNWTLSLNGGGISRSGPGVITQSGLPLFFQSGSVAAPGAGDTVVLPTISGSCSFSGTATIDTAGGGFQPQSQPVQGTVNSNTSITGTVGQGGTFTLSPNASLSGPVKALSGSWWAQGVGFFGNVTIQPTGHNQDMSITSGPLFSTCNVSGTLTQEGQLNVFDASLTFTGGGCPEINGIAFESDVDYFQKVPGTAGPFLYLVNSSGIALEVFP